MSVLLYDSENAILFLCFICWIIWELSEIVITSALPLILMLYFSVLLDRLIKIQGQAG